jgi:hypothetical protein
MQTFKIRKDGFKEIKKKTLIRTIPIMLIAITAGIAISSLDSKSNGTDINIYPVIIPLMAILVVVGLYLGVNRQKAIFDSYTLTITNNLITREQLNTPTISIYFNEIKEIAKNKNGSFTITGKDATDLIGIPPQIENYLLLETILQDIQTITIKEKIPFLQKYQSLTSLLTIGLMLCVYTVNNKIIVALTGTLLVALMLWSFIKISTSKNIDSKTKKMRWWVLLITASIIGSMIFKLTGFAAIQNH